MAEKGHTELPWKWHWRSEGGLANGSIFAMPREGHAYAVAICPQYQKRERWKADADLIITAVNTYPAVEGMASSLEAMLNAWDSLGIGDHTVDAVNKWLDSKEWRTAIPNARESIRRFRSLQKGGANDHH